MANVGWIAVIAVAAALAGGPAYAQTPMADEITKVHAEARATLIPALPKRIDGTTVLTGVQADGVTLTYQYKIERDKTELPPEFDDALGKKALATACGNERGRKILAAGGRYGFEYTDKFDQTILQVTVTRNDCVGLIAP